MHLVMLVYNIKEASENARYDMIWYDKDSKYKRTKKKRTKNKQEKHEDKWSIRLSFCPEQLCENRRYSLKSVYPLFYSVTDFGVYPWFSQCDTGLVSYKLNSKYLSPTDLLKIEGRW